MNNLEYTVFVDAMATGTFGNLLLLPSAQQIILADSLLFLQQSLIQVSKSQVS